MLSSKAKGEDRDTFTGREERDLKWGLGVGGGAEPGEHVAHGLQEECLTLPALLDGCNAPEQSS